MSDTSASAAPPTVSDLQAARDAAVGLVLNLSTAITEFDRLQVTNPATGIDSARDTIGGTISQLDQLIREAEVKLAPVRDELDEASGKLDSDHVIAVQIANSFKSVAASLLQSGNAPTADAVHLWLLQLRSAIDRLALGIRNPSWNYETKSGIDFEAEKAARQRKRKNPSQGRIRCDPATRSVFVDDTEIASRLTDDGFRFVQAVAAAYPEPISWRRIRQLQGVKEQNQNRLVNALPGTLFGVYVCGCSRGYHFTIPNPTRS